GRRSRSSMFVNALGATATATTVVVVSVAKFAEGAWLTTLLIAGVTAPKLVVLNSPYRFVINPILDYILEIEEKNPDREIAVLVPELVVQRWYHYFLHNQRAALLKALLLLKGNQRIIVIDVPWYLSS